MVEQWRGIIQFWQIDLYAGRSIMDMITLSVVGITAAYIISYFFDKAGS